MKRRTGTTMARRLALLTLAGCLTWATMQARSQQTTEAPKPRPEYEGWPKPDVVLVVSGQQFGYIEPCGCTGLTNQKGGLARRDTMLEQLQTQRGWNVVPLDAGNQVGRIGAQAGIKYQFTINALRQMKYRVVGFGPDDLRLPVGELLAAITASTNDQGQSDLFVSANVDALGFVAPYRVIESGGLKIGVTCVLGEEARAKVTQDELQTRPTEDALREAIERMKAERCDVTVCLAQAADEDCRKLAQAVPGIDLMVAAAGVGEPRYQAEPIPGTRTAMIQAGLKGMYLGVVGVYKSGRPRLRYQRVALDARFEDSRRMLDNLAQYQGVLKEKGLAGLGLRPVPHVRGQFAGSESCGDCHVRAYEKWLETPHAHATDSIAHPTERSNIARHFDPECLSCHVTGWNPQGYYPYISGYVDLDQSKLLHGNGCENCHGPGKAHVEAENGGDFSEQDVQRLRQQMHVELSKSEQSCMECHDLDNSPDFHLPNAFQKYWEPIKHPWRD